MQRKNLTLVNIFHPSSPTVTNYRVALHIYCNNSGANPRLDIRHCAEKVVQERCMSEAPFKSLQDEHSVLITSNNRTLNFCIQVHKGPVINMNQLKSIYNSPFKALLLPVFIPSFLKK